MVITVKKALVTGASRGIGRAIALRLARDGFAVYVHYASREDKAREVLAEIQKFGGQATLVQADLREPEETLRLAEQVRDADVLVLNASVQIKNPWEAITPEEARQQLNCNYVSSLLLMQNAVPHMREAGWGRIVTIGSVQERKPHPDMLVYSASKAAQANTVQSLSLQLAGSGITVNNVAPGVINTDRNAAAFADKDYIQTVIDSIPAGYYGEPEDCAGIVSLLCSEEGRYITGQTVFVDGGKSVR